MRRWFAIMYCLNFACSREVFTACCRPVGLTARRRLFPPPPPRVTKQHVKNRVRMVGPHLSLEPQPPGLICEPCAQVPLCSLKLLKAQTDVTRSYLDKLTDTAFLRLRLYATHTKLHHQYCRDSLLSDDSAPCCDSYI